MTWLSIVATALGAVIALAGTLMTDERRQREQLSRDRRQECWQSAIELAYALDAAHSALRGIARSAADRGGRYRAAAEAMDGAGLYKARERLLVAAAAPLKVAGETAFDQLVGIRNAVRDGAELSSVEYQDAYHRFVEALWAIRLTVRGQVGNEPLDPGMLTRSDWSERATCDRCASGSSR